MLDAAVTLLVDAIPRRWHGHCQRGLQLIPDACYACRTLSTPAGEVAIVLGSRISLLRPGMLAQITVGGMCVRVKLDVYRIEELLRGSDHVALATGMMSSRRHAGTGHNRRHACARQAGRASH